MNRKIVLDTETTGLNPLLGDRVIEIAAIELFDDKNLGESFHAYINPERDIPPEATNIHGITNEFIKDKPLFSEIIDSLMTFISDSLIIAHNAEFDRTFINLEFQKCNKEELPKKRFIDSLQLAKERFKGESVSLDSLCSKFSIDLSSRANGHGALIDIKLLAQVYGCLIDFNQDSFLSFDLNSPAINPTNPENGGKITPSINFPYRTFSVNEADINRHKEFLNNKVKNAKWSS